MNPPSELSTVIVDKLDMLSSNLGIKDIYPEVRAYLPRSDNPDLLGSLIKGQRISLGDYFMLPEGTNYSGDWKMINMDGGERSNEYWVDGFLLDEKGKKSRLIVTRGYGSRSFILPPETGVIDDEYRRGYRELRPIQKKALMDRSKERPEVMETLIDLSTQLKNGPLPTEGSLDLLTNGLVRAFGNVEGGNASREFRKALGVDKKLLIPDEARRSFQKLGDNVGIDETSNAVPGVIYTHIGPDGLNVFTVVQGESPRAGHIPVKFLDVIEIGEEFKIQELVQDGSDKLRIDGLVDPETCLIPSGIIDVVWYNSRRELETYLKIAKVKVGDLVQKGANYLVSEMIRFRERGY